MDERFLMWSLEKSCFEFDCAWHSPHLAPSAACILILLMSPVSQPFLQCSVTSVTVRTGITMPGFLFSSKQLQMFGDGFCDIREEEEEGQVGLCTPRVNIRIFLCIWIASFSNKTRSISILSLSILNLPGVLKGILWHLIWDRVSLAARGEGIVHLSSAVTQARLGRIMVSFNSRGQMGDGPISLITP